MFYGSLKEQIIKKKEEKDQYYKEVLGTDSQNLSKEDEPKKEGGVGSLWD